ncbi:hypothetical protein GCM10010360_65170 [Streptomyces nogalater]
MCVRLAEDEVSEGLAWESAPVEMLYAAEPWRTFRWYMGQKHYSGSYWSSTQSDHVIYEPRLELSRLLYLMATTTGPLVVDVKPRHRVARAEHAFAFAWTREAVGSRGWRYEVWSEPPDAEPTSVSWRATAATGCSSRTRPRRYRVCPRTYATRRWTRSRRRSALSRTIRPALSCYLLLIGGARGDLSTAARLLWSPAEDRLGPHMAHRLTKQGHWPAGGIP